MPEETKTTTTPATTTTQPSTTASTAAKDKFEGKSREEILESYKQLESKLGELGPKAKIAEEFSAIKNPDGTPASPQQVTQALDWARQTYARIQAGELTPKQAEKELKKVSGASDVVDALDTAGADWDTMTPGQMAKTLMEQLGSTIDKKVDSKAQGYLEQLNGVLAQKDMQVSLLTKALKASIKDPSVDPEVLITEAAKLSAMKPEDLLNLALNNLVAPKTAETELQKKINEGVQAELQKREADSLKSITPRFSSKPKFEKTPQTRKDEEALIFRELAKQNINLNG